MSHDMTILLIPLPWISSCLDRIYQTVTIETNTVEIEEKGIKLRLTVVDTPGFADAVDNTDW